MSKTSKALRELLLARAAGMIDSEEFSRREAALHAELLADHAAASRRNLWLLGAMVGLVAIAIGVYAWQANPPAAPPPMAPIAMPAAPAGGDLKTMAVRLAEKLAKNPTNGEGWALLGQTYVELGQYKEADQAFARADALGMLDARLRDEWVKAKAALSPSKPAP